jgi:hypothetical protein
VVPPLRRHEETKQMCVFPRIQPVCNGASIDVSQLDGMRFIAQEADGEAHAEQDSEAAADGSDADEAVLVELAAAMQAQESDGLLRSNDQGHHRLRTRGGLLHDAHGDEEPPVHIGPLPNERWVRVRLSPYHGVKDVKDIKVQPFVWIKRRYELPLLPNGAPNYSVTTALPSEDE